MKSANPERSKRRKKIALRVLLFGLATYIGVCYALADAVVTRSSHTIPERPKELEVWQPIPNVPAWASPAVGKGTAKNVFIFSHGLKANRAFFKRTALEMVKRGHDVVLLPLPGHDEHPDDKLGFGPKEAALIRSTIDALKAENIVLVGCSMGGAASWLASDHPRVDGIVTECAFGNLDPVTRVWFDRKMPGGSIILRPVVWIASLKVGINPGDINPIETAKKWDSSKPSLVIQAAEDKLIPLSQSRELAEATAAEYWVIPSLKHACCQDIGAEYDNRVESVMTHVLKYKKSAL
ncbi:MAG TPA: alpha/beta hydrolase [Fimbriimonas sp.]|nr:alpha/beta hydrolase [Fimbriimonas sp.]